MAPSCLATALEISASEPCSLAAITLIRAVWPDRLSVAAALADRFVVPVDVDEPLRRRGESGQGLAFPPVDGDALAGGDDADDLVAGHRMAAAGEVKAMPGTRPVTGMSRSCRAGSLPRGSMDGIMRGPRGACRNSGYAA